MSNRHVDLRFALWYPFEVGHEGIDSMYFMIHFLSDRFLYRLLY
jgi:hypothetical protein